jgi:hypothetical protein
MDVVALESTRAARLANTQNLAKAVAAVVSTAPPAAGAVIIIIIIAP